MHSATVGCNPAWCNCSSVSICCACFTTKYMTEHVLLSGRNIGRCFCNNVCTDLDSDWTGAENTEGMGKLLV